MEKDIVRGPLAWDWEAEESKGKVRHVDLRADVLVSTGVCLRCLRGCSGKSRALWSMLRDWTILH